MKKNKENLNLNSSLNNIDFNIKVVSVSVLCQVLNEKPSRIFGHFNKLFNYDKGQNIISLSKNFKRLLSLLAPDKIIHNCKSVKEILKPLK